MGPRAGVRGFAVVSVAFSHLANYRDWQAHGCNSIVAWLQRHASVGAATGSVRLSPDAIARRCVSHYLLRLRRRPAGQAAIIAIPSMSSKATLSRRFITLFEG